MQQQNGPLNNQQSEERFGEMMTSRRLAAGVRTTFQREPILRYVKTFVDLGGLRPSSATSVVSSSVIRSLSSSSDCGGGGATTNAENHIVVLKPVSPATEEKSKKTTSKQQQNNNGVVVGGGNVDDDNEMLKDDSLAYVQQSLRKYSREAISHVQNETGLQNSSRGSLLKGSSPVATVASEVAPRQNDLSERIEELLAVICTAAKVYVTELAQEAKLVAKERGKKSSSSSGGCGAGTGDSLTILPMHVIEAARLFQHGSSTIDHTNILPSKPFIRTKRIRFL